MCNYHLSFQKGRGSRLPGCGDFFGLRLVVFLLFCSCSNSKQSRCSAMTQFVDDYFNAYFEWNPSAATSVGFHQYDGNIEDYSAAAGSKRIETLKLLQGQISGLASRRTPDEEIDIEILDGQIRAELVDLETLETWRHNPMNYVSVPGGAIDNLMKRNFAPAAERLRSVIARLKGIPKIVAAMKQNIDNPPREFTELAFRIAHGSVGFFRTSVANWAKDAAGDDTALLNEFATANAAAANSLQESADWLQKTLLPKSRGTFAIGRENFSKKLVYEEMVDEPLERILAIGEENLERDYHAFIETALKIDPSKDPHEVMKLLSDEHPTEASLIPDAKKTVEGIIHFIRDQKIISIPSEVRPSITETPPYARSGTFASMDTPGPYETKATEAFYYITPVEPEWDAKHKEEHLRLYNPWVVGMINVHEAYPGHYLQFLYAPRFPTKTRKLARSASNSEGWAHYAEQMAVDNGFGDADSKMRLAQLQEALLRDCRYVVGIQLHTAGWTVEQGAKLFVEQGFQ